MSESKRNAADGGSARIGGSVIGSNVQMGSGTVYGGMHVTTGASSSIVEQVLAAVEDIRDKLSSAGVDPDGVEQARGVALIIEREVKAEVPDRSLLRSALSQLQNLMLVAGPIAGAVNNLTALLKNFGVY